MVVWLGQLWNVLPIATILYSSSIVAMKHFPHSVLKPTTNPVASLIVARTSITVMRAFFQVRCVDSSLSIIRQPCPSGGVTENRCFFGSFRAVQEHNEARGRKYASSKEYTIPVVSFVKSHLAANAGKYPTISLVIEQTGGSLYVVKKILSQLKSGKLDLTVSDTFQKTSGASLQPEEVSAETLVNDASQPGMLIYGDAERSEQLDIGIGVKTIEESCAVKDGSDILNQHEVERSKQSDIGIAGKPVEEISVVKDIPDLICNGYENTDMYISHRLERSVQVDTDTTVQVGAERNNTPGYFVSPTSEASSEIKTDDGDVEVSDNISNMMQASGKATDSEEVVLSGKPVYLKTNASRRVNLSSGLGIEDNSSWKETLSSILPDPPKRELTSNESKHACAYGISLTSASRKSILSCISKEELRAAFNNSEDILKTRIIHENGLDQAFIYFKTKEGLQKAWEMKADLFRSNVVKVEQICLGAGKETVEQASLPPEEESIRAFSQALNRLARMPSMKKAMDTSRFPREKVLQSKSSDGLFSSLLAVLEPASSRRSPLPQTFNRIQNIVSIDKCPSHLDLDNLKDIFSRYGEVVCCYAAVCKGGEQTCYIEFKNEMEKNKALEVQQFIVDGHIFQIKKDELPDPLVIRIKNIDPETGLSKVMNVCQTYSEIKSMKACSPDTVDVHFEPEKINKIQEMLDRLNEVTIDEKIWQATLLCPGFEKVGDLASSCEVCLQRQQDNLRLLSLTKQLLAHIEDMCARDRMKSTNCARMKSPCLE